MTIDTFEVTGTPLSCPSCHTARAGVAGDTWDSQGLWRCQRCGEKWTRSRLATVAEYEAWEREHPRV
jgi:transposase-like protein